MKKKTRTLRNGLINLLLAVSLSMIAYETYSQALFPGIGGEEQDMVKWGIMLVIGFLVALLLWGVKRHVTATDKLADSVNTLTMTVMRMEERDNGRAKSVNVCQHQINNMKDWIYKHVNYHQKCDHCPEPNEYEPKRFYDSEP